MKGPRWIKQWIADLALLNEQFRSDDGSVDFEALGREEYQFRTALITQKFEKSDRAAETYMRAKAAYDASSENGKLGGRPRKEKEETPDGPNDKDKRPASPRSSAAKHSVEMPSIEQLYDFAAAEGLDEADARDWFEMTVVERDGNDRNGKPIVNWKGACKRFCTARAKARNKNGENQ